MFPPVGNPVFARSRRLGRLGAPFVSFIRSFSDTHCRELSPKSFFLAYSRILLAYASLQCHRFKYAAMDVTFHRWKLGFNLCRFHHASRTCGASHYILSCLAAFPTCYFPLCLSTLGRLAVLEGICSHPSAPMELSTACRNGAQALITVHHLKLLGQKEVVSNERF